MPTFSHKVLGVGYSSRQQGCSPGCEAPALTPPTFIIAVQVSGAPGSRSWITHVHACMRACTHTHGPPRHGQPSMPLFGMARVSRDCVHSASHMPEKLSFESISYVIYTMFILASYPTNELQQDFFLKIKCYIVKYAPCSLKNQLHKSMNVVECWHHTLREINEFSGLRMNK